MIGPQAASQKKARVTAIAFRILGKLIHVNQNVLENFRLPPSRILPASASENVR